MDTTLRLLTVTLAAAFTLHVCRYCWDRYLLAPAVILTLGLAVVLVLALVGLFVVIL